jgi:hypothetical protein
VMTDAGGSAITVKEETSDSIYEEEKTLLDLDKAENDVFKIMSIVQQTCVELQQVPVCDMQKISVLSNSYFNAIKDIRETLVSYSGLIQANVNVSERPFEMEATYSDVLKSLDNLADNGLESTRPEMPK